MTYPREAIEAAANSARHWTEHGDWLCRNHWRNEDGFSGPAFVLHEYQYQTLPEAADWLRSQIGQDYAHRIDNGEGAAVADEIMALLEE